MIREYFYQYAFQRNGNIKHEYLRSSAYICLSLSLSPVKSNRALLAIEILVLLSWISHPGIFFSYLYSFKIHHIVLLPPLATMMGLEPNLRQLWVSVISCFTICRNHKICEWEFFQIFHEFELKNSILSNVLWNEMVELLNLVVNRIL